MVDMLGAKHGFAQSADCAARALLRDDPMDCLLNPRTAQLTVRKAQIYERSLS